MLIADEPISMLDGRSAMLVLNRGELVESDDVLSVIREAKQDYTRRLVDAIPNPYAHVSTHAG